MVELGDLWGIDGRVLRERLLETRTPETKFDILKPSRSLSVRPLVGQRDVPAIIRFVGNQPVVTEARAEPLKTGDAIDNIDGTAVPQVVANRSP